ncbi:MAG: hypothetical protein U0T78_07335 [Cloacibacterium normanense]
MGRTFEETLNAYNNFGEDNNPDRLFKIIYHLGKVSFDDLKQVREEIHFSAILKERVGRPIISVRKMGKSRKTSSRR